MKDIDFFRERPECDGWGWPTGLSEYEDLIEMVQSVP